jgi:hypothetical protein
MSTKTSNANWLDCPRCGQPRLVDSDTGMPEPCASCESRASKRVTIARVFAYLAGVAAVLSLLAVFAFGAYLLYYGILT